MKHYGDITKLKGDELPVVDCVTGGSPCQDLSVAGKRAGLEGERSGLFMEQIRIVKEMREHDKASGRSAFLVRPRYMVWENVPGALSSNQGKDFQAVLTEIVRIAEPDSPDVPMPEKKWSWSGCLYDDLGRWSVAWRVHNAQFWGVPQRRKRISLVADFGGVSAPEILFERKSDTWTDRKGKQEGQEAPKEIRERSEDAIAYTLKIRGGREIDSLGKRAGKGALVQEELAGTLGVSQDQTLILPIGHDIRSSRFQYDDCTDPLTASDYKDPIKIAYDSTVRRLSPLECERLQGFPDGWTDIGAWEDTKGKAHESLDSYRYKALGNSIAVGYANKQSGFWMWLMKRISAQYERSATLGSLFDGIGGFPLAWEFYNGKGSAIWASEIEEFCIAVTKKRFPEEVTDDTD